MQAQPNSSCCFVCGLDSLAGVRVRFCEGTVAAPAEGIFPIHPLSAISGQDVELPGWQVYNLQGVNGA